MVGLFVFIVAAAFLVVWLVPVVKHYIAVDRCLDSGGAFNYKTYNCDRLKSVPQQLVRCDSNMHCAEYARPHINFIHPIRNDDSFVRRNSNAYCAECALPRINFIKPIPNDN